MRLAPSPGRNVLLVVRITHNLINNKLKKKIKGSRTEWVNLTHLKAKKQDSYVICGANEACNVSRVFRVLHACIL